MFTVTTDNAANIKNAVVNKLNLEHLGCIGHTLQLSIGKALKTTAVARVLGRVRKMVSHFHMSTKKHMHLGKSKFFCKFHNTS